MRRWILCFVLLGFVSAQAKIYVDITGPSSYKVGIALNFSGYPLKKMQEVLKRDLLLYDIFILYPVERIGLDENTLRLAGADLLLSVDASVLGDRLKVAYIIKDLTDGDVIRNAVIQSKVAYQVQVAHRIADALYNAVTGSKGMFSQRAVAFRKVAGGYELVLLDVGAMEYKRLIFFKRPAQAPDLSPDGSKIAFSLMGKNGDFDIYVYDLRTGTYKKACGTKGPDTAPKWLPDGRHIVFAGNYVADNTDILECDVETGKIVKRLTTSISIDTMPTVSPDGSKIAFVSNRGGRPNIYIKELDTGLTYKVTNGYYDVSPSWSPKGDSILFSSLVSGVNMIGIYNVNTGTVRYITKGEDPTWAPNGDYVLYVGASGLYMSSIYGNSGEGTKLFVGKWINPSWR